MNEQTKQLVRYVVYGNMSQAKKQAEVVLKGNKAVSDTVFVENMLKELTRHTFFEQLPSNISAKVQIEDTRQTFIEGRYFLTEREQHLCDEILKADKLAEKLTAMKIRYLNSTLLYGQSGTGKTTFAKYIAYKLGIPFLYMNFSECIESLLGKTSKNISEVFSFAKKQRCVLMIDEIDAIGSSRTNGSNDSGEMKRITLSVMQALDTVENDTIILAATNIIDVIDKALLRRFSRKHEVLPLQNNSEKVAYVSKYFADVGVNISPEEIKRICLGENRQSELEKRIIAMIISKVENEAAEVDGGIQGIHT